MNLIIGTEFADKIGIYEILRESEKQTKDGHKLYVTRCVECGMVIHQRLTHAKRASTCHHIGLNNKHIDYHRRWKNKRLCKIFRSMMRRCYSPQTREYRFYGAKGITICEEWRNDSRAFEDWAFLNGYTDEMTIDRINPSQGYFPDNCRWIPALDNSKYKSTTTLLDVDGVTHTGNDWSKQLALGITTINTYLRKYPEDTVKEFIRRRLDNPNITRKSKQTWLDAYGLS